MDNFVLKNQVGQILGLIVEVTNTYILLVKILKKILNAILPNIPKAQKCCYFLKAFPFIIVILPGIVKSLDV